jgi:hypothetical protein
MIVSAWRAAEGRDPPRPLEDHNLRVLNYLQGIIAPWVLDGPINRDAFEVYVEKVLIPTSRVARQAFKVSSASVRKLRQFAEVAQSAVSWG